MLALTAGICTMLESTISTRDPLTTLASFQVVNVECCFATFLQMDDIKRNGYVLSPLKKNVFSNIYL